MSKYLVVRDLEQGGYEILDEYGNEPLGDYNYMFHSECTVNLDPICRLLNTLAWAAVNTLGVAK